MSRLKDQEIEMQELERATYEELKEKGLEGINNDLKNEINGLKEDIVSGIESMLDEEYDGSELEDLKGKLEEIGDLFRAKEEIKDEICSYEELCKKYD